MFSHLDVLRGYADGDAIFDDPLSLRDNASGDLVPEGNPTDKRDPVLGDTDIDLIVQERRDIVVGVHGQTDASHGDLSSGEGVGPVLHRDEVRCQAKA